MIWTGVIVVLLSFVASFLGASLARSADNAEPVETATPTASATQPTSEDYAEAIEEILPAGSAVRAGTGVPEAGKGYQGDVYIDVTTSDVYVFLDDEWVFAGNIRQSAAENLTGETGAAGADGATGATGATGETGAPGAPGTQILLGSGTPDNETCTADGDIYIDTDTDRERSVPMRGRGMDSRRNAVGDLAYAFPHGDRRLQRLSRLCGRATGNALGAFAPGAFLCPARRVAASDRCFAAVRLQSTATHHVT